MVQKLTLNKSRLPNKILPAKVRDLGDVSPPLWKCLEELCEGRRRWPLFLHGPVGTGKSCAALSLVDRVANAEFWAMPDFVAHVQSVKEGRAEYYNCGHGGRWTLRTWWLYVANMPLLVLDDVGLRELNDDSQMETLFLALEAREGKPLICTSNLNEKDVENTYNYRIKSRLCCGTIYELRGRDRRYPEDEST